MDDRSKKEWIIYCSGQYGEKTLMLLRGMGEHVSVFIDNNPKRQKELCWGRPILSFSEARKGYPDAKVMIANQSWKTSLLIAEELEKEGLERNIDYEISLEKEAEGIFNNKVMRGGIRGCINNHQIVIFGNPIMSELLAEWITNLTTCSPIICSQSEDIEDVKKEYPNAVWVLVRHTLKIESAEDVDSLFDDCRNAGVKDLSRFFANNLILCGTDKDLSEGTMCEKHNVSIVKVCFVYESSFSGTLLINNVLDFHPCIMSLEYTSWGWDIWYLVRSVADSNNIPSDFLALMEETGCAWDDRKKSKFKAVLEKYFEQGESYTEKDIFVGIFLAYYEFVHGNSASGDMWIYIDAHSTAAVTLGALVSWVRAMSFEPVFLRSIRHPIRRLGSSLNYFRRESIKYFYDQKNALPDMLASFATEVKNPWGVEEITYRFEDIKVSPRETIEYIIQKLGIPWDDSLLTTTLGGEEFVYRVGNVGTTGFDIKPVWNPYNEYFNSFDKLRLDILFREKEKAYGYSYVSSDMIPEEIVDLENLFGYPWKVEGLLEFEEEDERGKFHHNMENVCRQILRMEKDKEIYHAIFEFGEFYHCAQSDSNI